MTKKLFLLATILFLLISLNILLLSLGCKATSLTLNKAPDVPEDQSEIAEIKSISFEKVNEIIKSKENYILDSCSNFDCIDIIVDVRTVEEYNAGHLKGALLIPVQELEDRLNKLPIELPIIVYSNNGDRSMTAANILLENGFKIVYDMGGISDWAAEGYPVIVEE